MFGLARFQSIYKLVLDADIIWKRRCMLEGLWWFGHLVSRSHGMFRYDNMTNDALLIMR